MEGAIAALHQLLALAPEDVSAHQALAQQLMSLGEYGQAARLYGRLVRLDADNPRHAIMQTEMQRMAEEVEAEKSGDSPSLGGVVEKEPAKATPRGRSKR